MASILTPLPHVIQIDHVNCGDCGIHFGLERSFNQSRIQDRKRFYCPNGCHIQYLGPTEADRLKDKLAAAQSREDQLKAQAEQLRGQIHSKGVMLSQERSRVRGLRGAITKAKKRAAAGVCPCCTRTFQNLARHMKGQHPGYAGEGVTGG